MEIGKIVKNFLSVSLVFILFVPTLATHAKEITELPTENKNIVNGSDLLKQNGIQSQQNENMSLKEIQEEYDLEELDLSTVPDNIPIITFDSEADLQKFIEEAEKAPSHFHQEINLRELPNSNEGGISLLSTFERNVSYSESNLFGLGAKYSLLGKLTIYSSGSFHSITKVSNVRTTLTGITIGYNYKQQGARGKIASNGQSAYLSGEGILDYVLFFGGIGKVYSRPISISSTFYL